MLPTMDTPPIMHNMLYVASNSDTPTVAVVTKPVLIDEQWIDYPIIRLSIALEIYSVMLTASADTLVTSQLSL